MKKDQDLTPEQEARFKAAAKEIRRLLEGGPFITEPKSRGLTIDDKAIPFLPP